jgi:hypothetical protein
MARFEIGASIHFDKPYLVSRGSDDEGNAWFQCRLCLTKVLAGHVETHCASEDHKGRVRGATNIQGHPFAFACVSLQSRIHGLGSLIWQNEVKAALHDSLLLCAFMGAPFDHKPEIKKAKELISKYERKERVALLELAIWKAMSIATFQPNPESQGYHGWLEWMRHGWKGAKGETQGCNEIGIVIAAVRLFLDH